jgi:dGTPase
MTEQFNATNSRPSLAEIRALLDARESQTFSLPASKSVAAKRRRPEDRIEAGYRQAYSVDVDRILHSLAYMRYIDKTQVFYLIENDHITHRVLHVQLVSKIARSVGRFLGLNEDLIEAIALGHDIGHTPFGHDGESFLNDQCRAHGIGHFHHNVQSVQFLDRVERKGKGWNLCIQTLDGILCHDGETHDLSLIPKREIDFETLDRLISEKKSSGSLSLVPMTLEGCVVRMADTISYIGRDIEDAIRLKIIRRSDIPRECVKLLGDTNGTIVYNLVTDMIRNSYQKPVVAFGKEVSEILKRLKKFNYEAIYLNPKIKRHSTTIKNLFELLFERYVKDIERENRSSVIFSGFLRKMSANYIETHCTAEIVRDFLAGMTDRYFLGQCPHGERPSPEIWPP